MVALRLTRKGTKNRPYYKIVAIDHRKRRDGRYIEQIGSYDPLQEGINYKVDLELADKWLEVGAKPSVTVASIIKKARTGEAPPEKKKKPAPAAAEEPKAEAPKAEAPKAEAPKAEEPKAEAPAEEAPAAEEPAKDASPSEE
ncbi:MAG: 30S ribosomal protein S16 [Akkermansiaceae bacterium]|nr:30S ribosomal protein S16 [Akkermansiaceae bacterium]